MAESLNKVLGLMVQQDDEETRSLKVRVQQLEETVSSLSQSLKTMNSSPQDDEMGSEQMAFVGVNMKTSGHVSRITLGDDGETLVVKKVR